MTTIIEDVKLDFQDVLLLPKRSTLDSRSKVSLTRSFTMKHTGNKYSGIPIVAANMDHTGTIEMAKAFHKYEMSVALHKFYTQDELIEFFKTPESEYAFYTMGISEEEEKKFNFVSTKLDELKPSRVCIDVANGYSRKFVTFVEKLRENYPHLTIMAGNVVTPDMTYDLLERGADIVKVGIGPGSVCTTRKITGVGYPQLSAIMECADAAHGAGGLICGDGGITCSGDVVKAFAGGADFVMCGGLFAGHAECSGEVVDGKIKDSFYRTLDSVTSRAAENKNEFQLLTLPSGKDIIVHFDPTSFSKYASPRIIGGLDLNRLPISCYENPNEIKMKFYGMSSEEAMNKYYGGKADYRAGEGKVVEVPYRGNVTTTVEETLGGIRSACTYIGAQKLKDLPKCATFIKTNRQLNNVFGESK